MDRLAPDSGLQAIGNMARHAFADPDRDLPDVAIELFGPVRHVSAGARIRRELDQWDQVRGVERVAQN